jgi:orotate phosphoribosyltransferase
VDVRKEIANAGAVLEGDFFFALKSRGKVSCKYINLDPVFTYPNLLGHLAFRLLRPWRGRYDVIAGPAVGGIPLIFSGASAEPVLDIRTVWADKKHDDTFAFERMGFARAMQGKRVLLLEDIASTGDSVRAVRDLVEKAGGTSIGASFVWNRGKVTAEAAGVPELKSLVEESVETWNAGEHPMWGKWPLVGDIGHPEYFPNYPGQRINLITE